MLIDQNWPWFSMLIKETRLVSETCGIFGVGPGILVLHCVRLHQPVVCDDMLPRRSWHGHCDGTMTLKIGTANTECGLVKSFVLFFEIDNLRDTCVMFAHVCKYANNSNIRKIYGPLTFFNCTWKARNYQTECHMVGITNSSIQNFQQWKNVVWYGKLGFHI